MMKGKFTAYVCFNASSFFDIEVNVDEKFNKEDEHDSELSEEIKELAFKKLKEKFKNSGFENEIDVYDVDILDIEEMKGEDNERNI